MLVRVVEVPEPIPEPIPGSLDTRKGNRWNQANAGTTHAHMHMYSSQSTYLSGLNL